MYGVALLTSTLLTIAGARIYERCELARDLLKLGVRKEHIATWVCIAYHESRLDTAARNPSSGDHGLLQISQIYWCGAGKACGLPCSALRDDDISDDVECAQTIYEEHTRLQGNGFLAWVVYPNYCKQNPKKYLADCNLSVRDGSLEGRGRSSQVYDPYPALNSTLSNSVQRMSYLQSDQSLPGYLAIAALVRGKFESDFERDYNYKHKVLQSQSRVSNINNRYYDFLAPFTTKRPEPSTTTTTMQPEPYYKPVRPWRVIETNQFRRRMMNFDKTKSENMKELTKFISTSVSTTPASNINIFTNNKLPNTLSQSPSLNGTFEKEMMILNKTCCISDGVSTHVPNLQKYNTYVSFNTQSSLINSNPTNSKTEITNPTTYWNSYSRAWPTPASNLIQITTTKKPTETSISNSNIKTETTYPSAYRNAYSRSWTTPAPNLKQITTTIKSTKTSISNSSIKTLAHQYGPTVFSPTWTTTNRPFTTTVKEDTLKFDLIPSTGTAPKEKGVFITNISPVEVTTSKTAITTQGTTKGSTVRQLEHQLHNSQNIGSGNKFKTEIPQTTWRRGKSWSTAFQEVPRFGVEWSTPRNLPPPTVQLYNEGNLSEGVQHTKGVSSVSTQPTRVFNSVPTPYSNVAVDSTIKQITTEKPLASTTPSTKTTLSIFDLYLNPTKRPQLPNYKFLFSHNSDKNLKIFSGGTTSSPINKS